MSEKEWMVSEQNTIAMPALSMQQATQRYQQMNQFVGSILKKGIDYGEIPGTGRNTLLKPGAEKLTTFFGLTPKFSVIEKKEDWDAAEPFFYYWFRCHLYRRNLLVAEGDGSCNSRESRYRWRWVPRGDIGDLPGDAKTRSGSKVEFAFAVKKGETAGKYGKPQEYWQEFRDAIEDGTAKQIERSTKAGRKMSAWEIGSTLYRVPNEDIASQVNTIQKMAQKRALVAATLIGVNASDYFTQDLEDLDYGVIIEGVATQVVESSEHRDEKTSKTNGKAKRPLPADKLMEMLHLKIHLADARDQDTLGTAKIVGLVASKLEECFAPNEKAREMRLAVLGFIFPGVKSAKELSYAACSALLDWVLVDESGVPKTERTYDLHPKAPAEAAGLYAAARKAEMELLRGTEEEQNGDLV